MAIDPITAKILAQMAAQAATDEQVRKRLLCITLGPIIFLLLLIVLILYLITSPFSMLAGWLIGDELAAVEDFQKDYGYNQSMVSTRTIILRATVRITMGLSSQTAQPSTL